MYAKHVIAVLGGMRQSSIGVGLLPLIAQESQPIDISYTTILLSIVLHARARQRGGCTLFTVFSSGDGMDNCSTYSQ